MHKIIASHGYFDLLDSSSGMTVECQLVQCPLEINIVDGQCRIQTIHAGAMTAAQADILGRWMCAAAEAAEVFDRALAAVW